MVSLLVPEQTREVEVRAPDKNPRTSGTQIRPVDSLLALEEVTVSVVSLLVPEEVTFSLFAPEEVTVSLLVPEEVTVSSFDLGGLVARPRTDTGGRG